MKLLRLSMFNFMPYKGEVSLDFPTDSVRNTLIVFGDNMRGKTSLLNAIRWTFYGYALGRHLRKIPLHLLLNREAAAESNWKMETRIEFEADGSRYDLRRIAEKKSVVTKPDKPEDFIVTLYLQKDGSAIPACDIDLEINKYVPEQVSRFFLFDGELLQEYEELLIEGSEQGKKIKEAIEQALGVPALIYGRDDLYDILKRYQKLQSQEVEKVKGMEGLAERQQEWSTRRESLEADLLNLKERHQTIKNERLMLDDEIERFESVYVQKKELDLLVERSKNIDKEIKQREQSRLELIGHAWRDLLSPKLKQKRDELYQKQQKLTDALGDKSKIQMLISQHQSMLQQAVCPSCTQAIGDSLKSDLQNKLTNLQGRLAESKDAGEELASVSATLQTVNRMIGQDVSIRIEDNDKELARLERELAKIENRVEELKHELEGANPADVIRKRSHRDHLQKEEAKLSYDIENRESELIKADKELRIISQRIAADESRLSSRGSQLASYTEGLYEIFSKSIEYLRNTLRKTVEHNASLAFQSLSTQKAYRGLSINENYGLKILDHLGDEVPVRSAGAEQIVALSLIDGLSRAGRASGPVVMDTPFGRLDLKHRKNILGYLPTSATQLVLFVHDGEIRGTDDLTVLAHRIGGQYEIKEISPNQSVIEIKR